MIPIAKFRIYPNNKTLFYKVFVWRTIADLRAANPGNSHALGLCKSYRVIRVSRSGTERMTPCIGEIHFCMKWLRAGVIAHELTHALFGWLSEVGLPVKRASAMQRESDGDSGTFRRDDPEEIACRAMGDMYRQTCVGLNKRKLI